MGRHLSNIFRLGLKELRSLSRDVVMLLLIVYTFTIAVHDVAKGVQTEVKNAAVAVIDDDGSEYSRRLIDAIQPPYFQPPTRIDRRDVDSALDHGAVTFVLDLPPNLEKDLLTSRQPEIGLDIDATAMTQAGVKLSGTIDFSVSSDGKVEIQGADADQTATRAFLAAETSSPSFATRIATQAKDALKLSATIQQTAAMSQAARYGGNASGVMSMYTSLMQQSTTTSAVFTLSSGGSSLVYPGSLTTKA